MITTEQLKNVESRCEQLKRYLDIDSKKIEVEEEELRTHVADFWDDREKAEAQMRKIKGLHFWIDSYTALEKQVEELSLAMDFLKEGLVEEGDIDAQYAVVEKELEKLELRNMLRREEDKLGVVLKINSGAGGQNVNKVESGVRLRYQYKDPYTGEEEEILIENTETRDQPKNKENAMRQLRSILYDKELQHRMEEQAKVEAGKKKIEWGSQIRSYVFDDRRVKDHRTNYQTSDVNSVMDGEIDEFIKAYLMEFAAEEAQ